MAQIDRVGLRGELTVEVSDGRVSKNHNTIVLAGAQEALENLLLGVDALENKLFFIYVGKTGTDWERTGADAEVPIEGMVIPDADKTIVPGAYPYIQLVATLPAESANDGSPALAEAALYTRGVTDSVILPYPNAGAKLFAQAVHTAYTKTISKYAIYTWRIYILV